MIEKPLKEICPFLPDKRDLASEIGFLKFLVRSTHDCPEYVYGLYYRQPVLAKDPFVLESRVDDDPMKKDFKYRWNCTWKSVHNSDSTGLQSTRST
ncbi:hypothetical protein BDV28DRAFT_134701 [Aspergillus coremiiformis]|uniref:Uncharacterized protein n=1 Tax=Aspergillus coremiiformis TaxID=138285 RepID=A0A5N6Z7K2_9EURO|nr:hypothetical protein BDV28DRAFT_134701 [Aspergillus coremiiformis]